MKEHYFRRAEGFVFVFSITDRNSFDVMEKYIEEAFKYKRIYTNNDTFKPPVGIAANKCDLQEFRSVSGEEIKSLTKQHGLFSYECSAKTGLNVDKIFEQLAKEILECRRNNPVVPTKTSGICILL